LLRQDSLCLLRLTSLHREFSPYYSNRNCRITNRIGIAGPIFFTIMEAK
jgi:hypothetical protein